VNTKYLVAAFCEDDDFDTDQGYRGTNQFWFGIKPPWQGSSDSRGFETDGDLNQNAAGELPKSQWVVHNATLIGRGKNETGFGGGVGWNARDEAAPNVINSIFAEFALGVLIDNDGVAEFDNGLADLRNTILDVALAPSGANTNAQQLFSVAGRSNVVEAAMLGGISYTNNAGLNPRPLTGGSALSNVAAQGEGLVQTSFRGAFSENDTWADGWTALARLGFLATGAPQITEPTLTVALSNGQIQITFPSAAGRSYQVQSSTDPGRVTWENQGDALQGTGAALTFTDALEHSFKFFRVLVQ
jgi:hypothetical protein